MIITKATISILNDVRYYLERIDAIAYNQTIPLLFNGTIGKHTRHLVELYQCLLFREDKRIVNYDARKRDTRIETDVIFAQLAVQEIQESLDQLSLEDPVSVETEIESGVKIPSTIYRELLYNYEHCVHHLALIKVGLTLIQEDLVLPAHFGIAPATVTHREKLEKYAATLEQD